MKIGYFKNNLKVFSYFIYQNFSKNKEKILKKYFENFYIISFIENKWKKLFFIYKINRLDFCHLFDQNKIYNLIHYSKVDYTRLKTTLVQTTVI